MACSTRCRCGRFRKCSDNSDCGPAEFCGVAEPANASAPARLPQPPTCQPCALCRHDSQAWRGVCAEACPSGALEAAGVPEDAAWQYVYAVFAISEDEQAGLGLGVAAGGVVAVTETSLRSWLGDLPQYYVASLINPLTPLPLPGPPPPPPPSGTRSRPPQPPPPPPSPPSRQLQWQPPAPQGYGSDPGAAAAEPTRVFSLGAFATRLAALSPLPDPLCPQPSVPAPPPRPPTAGLASGSRPPPAPGVRAAPGAAGVPAGGGGGGGGAASGGANGTAIAVVPPTCPCNASKLATTFRCPVGHRCSPRAWLSLPADVVSLGSTALLKARCVACDPGSYCPEGTFVPEGAERGMTEIDCPAGHFCPTPSTKEACPPGYFCRHRWTAPLTCDYFELLRQAQDAIVSGSPSMDMEVARDLLDRSLEQQEPLRGNYCPNGSVLPNRRCRAGFYCPEPSHELPCLPGHFCRAENIVPARCPPLTLCSPGAAAPQVWPAALLTCCGLFICTVCLAVLIALCDRSKQRSETDQERRSTAERTLREIHAFALRRTAATTCPDLVALKRYNLFVKDLSSHTDGRPAGQAILNGVTARFHAGCFAAVMGPSGCGKSTLLSLVAGRGRWGFTTTGTIELQDPASGVTQVVKEQEALRRIVGYVPQDDVVCPDLTVRENLEYCAALRLPRRSDLSQRQTSVAPAPEEGTETPAPVAPSPFPGLAPSPFALASGASPRPPASLALTAAVPVTAASAAAAAAAPPPPAATPAVSLPQQPRAGLAITVPPEPFASAIEKPSGVTEINPAYDTPVGGIMTRAGKGARSDDCRPTPPGTAPLVGSRTPPGTGPPSTGVTRRGVSTVFRSGAGRFGGGRGGPSSSVTSSAATGGSGSGGGDEGSEGGFWLGDGLVNKFFGRSATAAEQRKVVDEVLRMLDLKAVQMYRVGHVDSRIISGGQRKRLNIGLELVARPSVLFLDEPTSGLDASCSHVVLRSLYNLASGGGVNVVAVVHQPRHSVFSMFDEVLLLGEKGRTVYHAHPRGAKEYFEGLGYRFPMYENVADTLLDIVTGKVLNHKHHKAVQLPDIWSKQGGEWRSRTATSPSGASIAKTSSASTLISAATPTSQVTYSTTPQSLTPFASGLGSGGEQAEGSKRPSGALLTPTGGGAGGMQPPPAGDASASTSGGATAVAVVSDPSSAHDANKPDLTEQVQEILEAEFDALLQAGRPRYSRASSVVGLSRMSFSLRRPSYTLPYNPLEGLRPDQLIELFTRLGQGAQDAADITAIVVKETLEARRLSDHAYPNGGIIGTPFGASFGPSDPTSGIGASVGSAAIMLAEHRGSARSVAAEGPQFRTPGPQVHISKEELIQCLAKLASGAVNGDRLLKQARAEEASRRSGSMARDFSLPLQAIANTSVAMLRKMSTFIQRPFSTTVTNLSAAPSLEAPAAALSNRNSRSGIPPIFHNLLGSRGPNSRSITPRGSVTNMVDGTGAGGGAQRTSSQDAGPLPMFARLLSVARSRAQNQSFASSAASGSVGAAHYLTDDTPFGRCPDGSGHFLPHTGDSGILVGPGAAAFGGDHGPGGPGSSRLAAYRAFRGQSSSLRRVASGRSSVADGLSVLLPAVIPEGAPQEEEDEEVENTTGQEAAAAADDAISEVEAPAGGGPLDEQDRPAGSGLLPQLLPDRQSAGRGGSPRSVKGRIGFGIGLVSRPGPRPGCVTSAAAPASSGDPHVRTMSETATLDKGRNEPPSFLFGLRHTMSRFASYASRPASVTCHRGDGTAAEAAEAVADAHNGPDGHVLSGHTSATVQVLPGAHGAGAGTTPNGSGPPCTLELATTTTGSELPEQSSCTLTIGAPTIVAATNNALAGADSNTRTSGHSAIWGSVATLAAGVADQHVGPGLGTTDPKGGSGANSHGDCVVAQDLVQDDGGASEPASFNGRDAMPLPVGQAPYSDDGRRGVAAGGAAGGLVRPPDGGTASTRTSSPSDRMTAGRRMENGNMAGSGSLRLGRSGRVAGTDIYNLSTSGSAKGTWDRPSPQLPHTQRVSATAAPPFRPPAWFAQLGAFTRRSFVQVCRAFWPAIVLEIALLLAAAAAVGLNQGISWSPAEVPGNIITAIMCLAVLAVVQHLRTFSSNRDVLERERGAGLSATAYFTARCLVDLPLILVAPAIFTLPYYVLTVPRASFLSYYAVGVGVWWWASGLAYFVTVLPLLPPAAAPMAAVLLTLIAGALLHGGNSPTLAYARGTAMEPLLALSYNRWALEALSIAELDHFMDTHANVIATMYETSGTCNVDVTIESQLDPRHGEWGSQAVAFVEFMTTFQAGYCRKYWVNALIVLFCLGLGGRLLAVVTLRQDAWITSWMYKIYSWWVTCVRRGPSKEASQAETASGSKKTAAAEAAAAAATDGILPGKENKVITPSPPITAKRGPTHGSSTPTDGNAVGAAGDAAVQGALQGHVTLVMQEDEEPLIGHEGSESGGLDSGLRQLNRNPTQWQRPGETVFAQRNSFLSAVSEESGLSSANGSAPMSPAAMMAAAASSRGTGSAAPLPAGPPAQAHGGNGAAVTKENQVDKRQAGEEQREAPPPAAAAAMKTVEPHVPSTPMCATTTTAPAGPSAPSDGSRGPEDSSCVGSEPSDPASTEQTTTDVLVHAVPTPSLPCSAEGVRREAEDSLEGEEEEEEELPLPPTRASQTSVPSA